jgi:hypothetical protein
MELLGSTSSKDEDTSSEDTFKEAHELKHKNKIGANIFLFITSL